MDENTKTIIEQFVDYLSPDLTPYEISIYLYLFRNSFLRNGTAEVRIGKRTIAAEHGRSSRGEETAYAHVSEIVKKLEEKGCIKIGDTNREGTFYIVNLPKDIRSVAEKLAALSPQNIEEDYFSNSERREEIFSRDKMGLSILW